MRSGCAITSWHLWEARRLLSSFCLPEDVEAAKRIHAMIEDGDPGDAAVWKHILRAVEGLQRAKPSSGEVVY